MSVYFQIAIPPSKSNSTVTEYPMFVFSEGSRKDAQLSPKRLPRRDLEYFVENSDSDCVETEEFEIL